MGPVSTQAPLDWRYGERGDEFIQVCTDANIVMGAESACAGEVSMCDTPPTLITVHVDLVQHFIEETITTDNIELLTA
jgi:hypothetical protein